MTEAISGRLLPPTGAPPKGETTTAVARGSGFVIEQILSGDLEAPVDYCQDDDEWALVLAGSATLEVNGERLELTEGDWVLLPAGVPHRLVRTSPGTSWLTVRTHVEAGVQNDPL
jgi:cupin 2 domain-containing protein